MDHRELARKIVEDSVRRFVPDLQPGWENRLLTEVTQGAPDALVEDVLKELARTVPQQSYRAFQNAIRSWRPARLGELADLIESILQANEPVRDSDLSFGIPASIERLPTATLVRIFYATDRSALAGERVQYSAERDHSGQLHLGECSVSIPKAHKVGKLESPSILRLEFRPDPEKHIVLAEVRSLQEERFFQLVSESVAKSATKDALVFIHGYNVSFADCARRTGQIAFDLDFVGAPMFYSWPSNGRLADYVKDQTNASWSAPHLERFLRLLVSHSGAERIHLIAHSMGNVVTCEALKTLSYDPAARGRFSHLVLAAPDIDADTFRELASALQTISHNITLYASSKDKAIIASRTIHGNPRAGEPLLVMSGIDTIDASSIDTDFLAHSYFGDSWPLLSDIHSILLKDEPPSRRFGLVAKTNPDGTYYSFRP